MIFFTKTSSLEQQQNKSTQTKEKPLPQYAFSLLLLINE